MLPRWKRRHSNFSFTALFFLLVLLFVPSLAMLRLTQTLGVQLVLGYAALISLVAFFTYRHDKKQAQAEGWRTPESTLHFLELLGGWPGAFLAQRALRHKSSKTSYQIAFWAIVALHEFVSFDFLHGWQYSKQAILLFQ
jgi:uncharacterized membrane protein YsdA (DUF1294 family)